VAGDAIVPAENVFNGWRVGHKPLRIVVAGEPVVLFRGKDGAIGALIDRGPHRGAALSAGRVDDDRCIECPFKAVVESGGCDEVPPAGDEHSVATDRATLRFRKYYYQILRPSTAAVSVVK
jgi:phenylpropionate dioxygenase-like ring-hydroxylating dioxygenase large terminal subunit